MTTKLISKVFLNVIAIAVIITRNAALAQSRPDERALKLVAQFSEDVCGKYDMISTARHIEVNVGLQAKIAGLLKGLVNGGFGAEAKYARDDSSGVLQKDLAKLTITRINCRERVVGLVLNKLQLQSSAKVAANRELGDNKVRAYDIERGKSSAPPGQESQSRSPNLHIEQHSAGPNSPNVIGNNNRIEINPEKGWQRLTVEQTETIKPRVEALAGKSFKIVVPNAQRDQVALAKQLAAVFEQCGMISTGIEYPTVFFDIAGTDYGILVRANLDTPALRSMAAIISDLFGKENLRWGRAAEPGLKGDYVEIRIWPKAD